MGGKHVLAATVDRGSASFSQAVLPPPQSPPTTATPPLMDALQGVKAEAPLGGALRLAVKVQGLWCVICQVG